MGGEKLIIIRRLTTQDEVKGVKAGEEGDNRG